MWGTDDTRAIRTAFVGARSPSSRRLYFPQGTYLVNISQGDLLLVNAPRVEIFGDGIGLSIIQFANNITLTGSPNAIRVTRSSYSYIHDLSLYNGAGMGGTGNQQWTGILLSNGSRHCTVERVEVAGVYGANDAGGTGIAMVESWNSIEQTTTLCANVAGGGSVATCAPASMSGIYRGRRLEVNPNVLVAMSVLPQNGGAGYAVGDTIALGGGTFGTAALLKVAAVGKAGAVTSVTVQTIGSYTVPPREPAAQAYTTGSGQGATFNVFWNPEQLIVQSTTPTTFTARFQNQHSAGETVNLLNEGRGYHTIRECIVRDGYYSTGIGMACSANRLINNRIVNVGSSHKQHGFYDQGGSNHYEGNYCEGIGGWSYHLHKSTPNAEASGCRLIGNTSVDPGHGHLYVDWGFGPTAIYPYTNYQANPQVPLGASLDRYVQAIGNLFRRTNQNAAPGGQVSINVPAIYQGNVFEDGTGFAGQNWLYVGGNGSKVVGNTFRMLNTLPAQVATNSTIVKMDGAGCICETNSFEQIVGGGTLVRTSGWGNAVRNNAVILASSYSGTAFVVGGENNDITGNRIAGGGACNVFGAPAPGFSIHDNDFRGMESKSLVCFIDGTACGAIYNNSWNGMIRLAGATLPTALHIYNNDGAVTQGGYAADNLTRASGRLLHGKSGSPLTNGLCVKYDASGNFVTCTTADTGFVGIAVMQTGSGVQWACAAGLPGTEYPALPTDGPWAAGNIGVLSTTAPGKIHDTGGQNPPSDPAAAYVRFLNGGTRAGKARVLIVKTI
jgi:hypothetical protein